MKCNVIFKSKKKHGGKSTIPKLLEEACKKKGVTFVGHDVSDLGKSFTLTTLPELGKEDMLYRCAVDRNASIAEQLMMNNDVTSFYTNWKHVHRSRSASWYTHRSYGLPVIPSFPGIPSSKEDLDRVLEMLGPFPVIVKVMGGSLGVGVMRIDSLKSLQSVLDYLSSTHARVMLRKYIPHDYYVRAVVVGDKVVASHCAYAMDGEFRTNAGDDTNQKRKVIELSEEVQACAVEAVRVLGLETGGVDLLFDRETGKPYIAEVNFPNNFSVTQKVTGVDIAGAMIDYLVKKAQEKALTE